MDTNIIIFGDSIALGFFDDKLGGWADRLAIHFYEEAVKSDFAVNNLVFNLGISGDTITDVSKRFESEISARLGEGKKNLVILSIGINDSQVSIDTGESKTSVALYERTLRDMVQQAKDEKIPIALVGLLPVDEKQVDPIPWKQSHAYRNSEIQKFNAVIEKTAKDFNSLFIPMQDVFGDNPAKYLADGLHPNAEGHRLMFERVKEYLEREKII